eukprot:gb/GEZN01000870.1/.p1 GENE.gb/GEZN01000870.1/~~gb/GEZN01000870.1/.p1  ORF type:complete len:1160 (-),score=151.63 gb/GEZN01000870.1/:87-3125(-)
MLFLGTEKYPDENEYSRFLSSHGGSSNAYTGMEHTNFHFDVVPGQLEGALERFAQFFISPLFTPSATDRELRAVDSENVKNLQSDPWRRFQLRKSSANPAHPFSKFGSGNMSTLSTSPGDQNAVVREALLKYYQQYYSSSVMSLCVLGTQDLDTLEDMINSLFAPIKNTGRSTPVFPQNVAHPTKHAGTYRVVPIKDLRDLEISWYLPGTNHLYDNAVMHMIPHLLGHEGPGSLLSLLKQRGWVNGVTSGFTPEATCFSTVSVVASLTEVGLSHVSEIIRLIFQYLHLMKRGTSDQWKVLWQECDQIANMSFRFKGKESPISFVTGLSENIHMYRPVDVIYGPYMVGDFDYQTLRHHLDLLLDIERARISITSKSFAGQTDQKERWYGTEYSFQSTTMEEKLSWSSQDIPPTLFFPKRNLFIPTDFTLKFPQDNTEEELERGRQVVPVQLLNPAEDEKKKASSSPSVPHTFYRPSKCWWKPDTTFRTPKVIVIIDYLSPAAYLSPEANLLTTLYAMLFEDSVSEFMYDAELAGMSYSVTPVSKGFQVIFKGYNHRIFVLMQEILSRVRDIRVDKQRFDVIKEQLERSIRNFDQDPPYKHALYDHISCTEEKRWHPHEKLAVIQKLGPEDVIAHGKEMFKHGAVECLVTGNILKEEALEMMRVVEKYLQYGKLAREELHQSRIVALPQGKHFVYTKPDYNAQDKNSAVVTSFQVGENTARTKAISDLLMHIMQEPCFDQLRTKQQLGYIVHAYVFDQKGVLWLRVLVQSSTHSVSDLSVRIQDFLQGFTKSLQNLAANDWEKHRSALIASKSRKWTGLADETFTHWEEIGTRQYRFTKTRDQVAVLEKLTLDEVVCFWLSHVATPAWSKQLTVQLFGPARLAQGLIPLSAETASATLVTTATTTATTIAAGEGEGKNRGGKTARQSLGKETLPQPHPVLEVVARPGSLMDSDSFLPHRPLKPLHLTGEEAVGGTKRAIEQPGGQISEMAELREITDPWTFKKSMLFYPAFQAD